MERRGVGFIFLTVLLIGVSAKPAPNNGAATTFQPALAMHCGKATQYRDVDTGEWISDAEGTDCLKNNDDRLAYCKKAYPTLQITNVIIDTVNPEKVHVPSWCSAGTSPPCHGHGHNVVPYKCIVGQYQAKALEVPQGCSFEHTHDYKACKSEVDWKREAAQICLSKGQALSEPEMLKPCEGADLWQGVQFLCCVASLSKPKQSKGKPRVILPEPKIDVIDANTKIDPICHQPKKIGLCRALIPVWHFNSETGECEPFNYGGCGGNENNFQSETECEDRCLPARAGKKQEIPQDNSICGLPVEVGPCRASFPKWRYDPALGKCTLFTYGGCNGNENNFQLQDDCEARCKGYKSIEKPLVNLPDTVLPLGPGPVLLDEDVPVKFDDLATTTEQPATTMESFYDEETNIDNEHDVFLTKLDGLKKEHQDKVGQVLGKWDADNADTSDGLDVQNDLQGTISSLEDEYNGKMDALNEQHKGRMDRMLEDARIKMLQKLTNQLDAEAPKARHVLKALQSYLDVERQDKTHTLQHYFMALKDEFDENSIPDFEARLSDIDERVNSTRSQLDLYPELMERIQDEVDDLFDSMPPSPSYEDEEDEEEEDEEVLDVIEEEALDGTRIKIDDGGLTDTDICKLPPVVGMCRASIIRFHYNPKSSKCETFTYGGCGGNENNFRSPEACENACSNQKISFDINVLDEEEIDDDDYEEDDDEDEFEVDEFDTNSIQASMDDEEDEPEDESDLDEDVDGMFDINGDRKYDVILSDPQPLYVGDENPKAQIKSAQVSESHLLWIGIGAGVLLIMSIIGVLVYRRNPGTRPPRVVVDKVDSEKEMSPEEKQLLQLQQNGYENPTYKFFERQARA